MISKKIFGRIWATWGAIVFLITMLVIFIPMMTCYLWQEPRRSARSYPIFKLWMNIYLPLVGIRVECSGISEFRKGQNYVVIFNHRSMMDITVSTTRVPGPKKTIAKIEMSRVPVFGLIYSLGSVLVDRKDKASRAKSLTAMKAVLGSGLHMILYPEGTRNKTKEPLQPFQDGAFILAVETKTPVMIGIIRGAERIMPADIPFYLMPGRIHVEFIKSVMPGNDIRQLKVQCHDIMMKRLSAHH